MDNSNQPIENRSVSKAEPRDIFIHLLAMVSLYVSAGSFTALIFQYIAVLVPDPLDYDRYYYGAYQAIRFSIASLIIVFPVYVLTTRYLNGLYTKEPLKRNIRIRKWLIYFTLFVAALIIIGDLVALINNFLGGELTIRFLLKVVTVFFVAGSIFSYYFWDLKKNKEE